MYWVFTEFYRVLSIFAEFDWLFCGSTDLYLVLPSFFIKVTGNEAVENEFAIIAGTFTGFYRVFRRPGTQVRGGALKEAPRDWSTAAFKADAGWLPPSAPHPSLHHRLLLLFCLFVRRRFLFFFWRFFLSKIIFSVQNFFLKNFFFGEHF